MDISKFNETGSVAALQAGSGGLGSVDPKDKLAFDKASKAEETGDPSKPEFDAMSTEEQEKKLTEMIFSSGRSMVMQLADDKLKSPTGGEEEW